MQCLEFKRGKWAEVSKRGNITNECLVFIPGENHYFFSKFSPIIESAEKATQVNREKKEFCPTKSQLERATDSSVSIRIPIEKKSIKVNQLTEEIGNFILGNQAQEYKSFLENQGIKYFPVNPFFIEDLYGRGIVKPFVFKGVRELDERGLYQLQRKNLCEGLRTRGIYIHNK